MGGTLGTPASERERKCDRAKGERVRSEVRGCEGSDKATMTSSLLAVDSVAVPDAGAGVGAGAGVAGVSSSTDASSPAPARRLPSLLASVVESSESTDSTGLGREVNRSDDILDVSMIGNVVSWAREW